jgi:glutathione S-transferase
MSITIYGIAASRTVRPLWAADELGLAYRHESVPYLHGAARTPDMLALNPNGHIPVLKDERPEGDVLVWESMACTLYLARVHGVADGQGITPATPAEEAAALKWAFWAVTEVEADALTVLMHRVAMPAEQRKPTLADAAERRLRAPLGVLEQQLRAQQQRGHSWLAADRFTVADLCTAAVVGWAKPAKELMASVPLTHAWVDACLNRPAHQHLRALARAGR